MRAGSGIFAGIPGNKKRAGAYVWDGAKPLRRRRTIQSLPRTPHPASSSTGSLSLARHSWSSRLSTKPSTGYSAHIASFAATEGDLVNQPRMPSTSAARSYGHLLLSLVALLHSLPGVTSAHTDPQDGTPAFIFHSTHDVQVGPAIAAVGAIVLGAVLGVMGYRCVRLSLFCCGGLVGGLVLAAIGDCFAYSSKHWQTVVSWGMFLFGSLVLGSVALAFVRFGVFMIGAAAGLLLSWSLTTSVGYLVHPRQPSHVLAVLACIFGIAGGFGAIKYGKRAVVLASSHVGAQMLVWGVGYFAGHYPNAADLRAYATGTTYNIPMAWAAYASCIVIVTLLGLFLQLRKTARDVQHDLGELVVDTISSKTSKGTDVESLYQDAGTPRSRPLALEAHI